MGFLLFAAILAISFAWMWNRNDKAKKRLRRLRPTDEDEAVFAEWRDHTRKRMSRADIAALILTITPLTPLLGLLAGGAGYFVAIPFNICAWGALIVAFWSNAAGRKADALAEQLGFQRGVGWLAARKSAKKTAPPAPSPPPEPAIPNENADPTDSLGEGNNMGSDSIDAGTAEVRNLEREFKRAERKEGARNLALAALAILLIKTLLTPSTHVLLPDVADSGPREGMVIGFRYVKKTWWGFRKKTFDLIRFTAEKRPQYYDPDDSKWVDVPSEAYADAEDDQVDPYEPVEYFR